MSWLMINPQMFGFRRRIRAALTPPTAPPPTATELADEAIYMESRCYTCREVVADERDVVWMLGKTAGRRFLFHAACARQIQKSAPTATLKELLQIIREGR